MMPGRRRTLAMAKKPPKRRKARPNDPPTELPPASESSLQPGDCSEPPRPPQTPPAPPPTPQDHDAARQTEEVARAEAKRSHVPGWVDSGPTVGQEEAPAEAPPRTLPTPEMLRPGEPFPIVGIGASAGGLDAFNEFFENCPPDTGMA